MKLEKYGIPYFAVISKDGKKISTTKRYWDLIVTWKHPAMKGKEGLVKETLTDPDEIRVSKSDKKVQMYYKKQGDAFVCVVVKLKNSEGFIITTYMTNIVKEGRIIWNKK